ncbi:polysaccharide pyruvyl transferase family protein [Proteiniphilum saccharofermentans]|uniref:polysaccharide pyruvyl transferase family protein n=1 Tax=Proteiniphilum saccharofermentans TaxID=1642647 RepID=UPI0028A6F1F4|nr:polysaccharide pyruvyl transferase family protein [Proteiniphilum saccharofermentans]
MRILIVNQPLNNRGDEAAHKALLRALSEKCPTSKIQVLFINANQNSIEQFKVREENLEYLNILSKIRGGSKILIKANEYEVPFLWYLHPVTYRIIKLMKKVDLVVCAPGGICMGGFQDWAHISVLSIAKYLKKKVAYYGRSFGPFPEITKRNKRFKEISYKLLHYFDFLSIRDAKTQKLAEEIGVNYIPTSDTAFLDYPEAQIPLEIMEKIGANYAVFVPNELKWHYAFKNLNSDIISQFFIQTTNIILEKYPDHKIVMLPQIFNDKNQDELSFFEEIKNNINSNSIVILKDIYSSDIQQCIIRKSKFVVGARYHSIVFALNNNVPFVALSYEHKISGLLESLDIQDRKVDITKIWHNEESLNNAFKKVEKCLNSIEKDEEAQNKAKDIANHCMNVFVKNIINT